MEKKKGFPHTCIINLGFVDPGRPMDGLQRVYTSPEIVCKCVYIYTYIHIPSWPQLLHKLLKSLNCQLCAS